MLFTVTVTNNFNKKNLNKIVSKLLVRFFMKKDIHPQLFDVTVHCTCGNEFPTRSARKELKITLCSQCHPFYTGAQKFVDTAGRIEKFEKRYQKNNKK